MKRSLLSICLMTLCIGFTAHGADWRKTGSDAEKLKNLVDAVPGTSHWMIEMGERYKNLYWAGKQGKWEFAEYQLEEIEKLVQMVQLARPKRAATAQEFLDEGIPQMMKGLKAHQWKPFKESFHKLSEACMRCHAQNDHAFIILPADPKSASSPVLNLEMED